MSITSTFHRLKQDYQFPHIRQASLIECGTTSLAIILKYYGLPNITHVLNDMAQINEEGTSVFMLKRLAIQLGFDADGYQVDYETLGEIELPCLAHYDGNHFVVIYQFHPDYVKVSDPAIGKVKISREEFEQKWNGIILCLEATENMKQQEEIKEVLALRKQKRKFVVNNFFKTPFLAVKNKLVYALLACTLLVLTNLIQPLALQFLIDNVFPSNSLDLFKQVITALGILVILQLFISYLRGRLLLDFNGKFELAFFSKYFEHFIHLKQSYFDKRKRDDLVNHFQQNMRLRSILSPSTIEHVVETMLIVVYFAALFYLSPMLGSIGLILCVIYMTTLAALTPRQLTLSDKIANAKGRYLWSILDAILGIENIKLLQAERVQFNHWQKDYSKGIDTALTDAKKSLGLSTFLYGIQLLCMLMIIAVGAYLVTSKALTLGTFIAALLLYQFIIKSMVGGYGLWLLFTDLWIIFNKLYDTFSQKTEISDEFAINKPISFEQITFEEVTFSYNKGVDAPIIEGLNLNIKQGEYVGIVGRNGSGKSTLMKLLAKVYTNFDGDIRLGQHRLSDIHPAALRSQVFMLAQNTAAFNGTIAKNLTYGLEGITYEQMEEAIKLADFHDFVHQSILGYDLKIGEHGTKLSGGQLLKLAFARLFLRNPDVIILDEASSALDMVAEAKIMKNLHERFKGKTIISIAHRINTLRNADKIAVIDEGRILEVGTHDELLENKQLYFEFIQSYLQL